MQLLLLGLLTQNKNSIWTSSAGRVNFMPLWHRRTTKEIEKNLIYILYFGIWKNAEVLLTIHKLKAGF